MSLVGAPTADAWTEAATLRAPGATRFLIQVSNAAVIYQLGRSWPNTVWDSDEHALLPVVAALERRADAIRFRSRVPGSPALVDASAAGDIDVYGADR